jgi:hypothetical protein
MKRLSITTIAALALLASLLFAAPAMAAPGFAVQIEHQPSTIFKNDVFLEYEIDVENVGDEDTSGQLTAYIDLPQGLTLKRAEGTGWSCWNAAPVCESSEVVAPGGSYPTLELSEVRIDESAPQTPVAGVVVSGGGAPGFASAEHSFLFDPPVPFKLLVSEARAIDEAGEDVTQAGAHPHEAFGIFETTRLRGFVRGADEEIPLSIEDMHGGVGELPAGVVGNPETAAFCSIGEVNTGTCPEEAAVGGVRIFASVEGNEPPDFKAPREGAGSSPVYRLAPEKGFAASFGFKSIEGIGPSFVIRAKVRSDGDYGITTLIPLVPQSPKFFGANFAFCGFGAKAANIGGVGIAFLGCKQRDDVDARDAFITLGTDCSIGKPVTRFAVDSWLKRGRYADNGLPDLSDPNWKVEPFESKELTGCEQLTEEWVDEKEPSFTMQPDSNAADSPAAYTANLHIPQEGLLDPDGLGTSHLKDSVVTLPEGLSFNPAIAHRLEACSLEQMGYLGNDFPYPNRIRFDTRLPNCPEASKVGIAKVDTPLIGDPLNGSVFLAEQTDNPFGSDYAIYLAVEAQDLGVVVKLPGRVDLNPASGQITATFKDNPQLPFSDLELRFFGGDRAALANPVSCGSHEVSSQWTPWSAEDPENPKASEIATPTDRIEIDSGPNGAPCPSSAAGRPFDIGLSSGSANPLAGQTGPFSFRITRPDGSQELDRLEIAPPPGFVASLRGIPYCSDAQIAAATSRGSGKAEQASPSCPAASRVGSVNAGAGPGATPFYAPGELYLAGPYKSQPLSVVAITPAVAGPFDLGNVVIRSALQVDPKTARITAITDEIPKVFEGIPLRIRDIRIELDRPNWVQNPTSCQEMSVDMTAFGASGAVTHPGNRFQVGNCRALGFEPKTRLQLYGGVKRGKYQGVRAVVRPRPGDANISRTVVRFPRSAFVAQEHIRTVCTRVQFAADACPKGAIYGRAIAYSPLLDQPLRGNVYLRSSDNTLPDAVADLRGPAHQPIRIEVAVRNDAVRGALRNTVLAAPDAPVSYFRLQLFGKGKGLIVNSRNICRGKNQARVAMAAHNGRRSVERVKVFNKRCKKQRRAQRNAKRSAHRSKLRAGQASSTGKSRR